MLCVRWDDGAKAWLFVARAPRASNDAVPNFMHISSVEESFCVSGVGPSNWELSCILPGSSRLFKAHSAVRINAYMKLFGKKNMHLAKPIIATAMSGEEVYLHSLATVPTL
eukprot:scaffold82592_cov67-Cyclotella_meneghiniana.AAC.5